MSTASRIESIIQHIGDIYDTLELGGSDLTNVDKNIENASSELIDRYKDYLANGTDELWNNWDKATETGVNEATINNTIKGKMVITPKGDTEQFTTTGANLFDLKGFLSSHNIDYTENIDGSLTFRMSATLYSSPFKFSDENTTVSLSGLITNVTSVNARIELINSSGTSLGTISEGTTSLANKSANKIRFDYSSSGTTHEVTMKNIMLNMGSSVLNYEPYTAGASPNPSYPQEIKNVKGKNLLPFTNQDFTVNNVRYYVKNGSLYLNGTSVSETSSKNANFKNNFNFTLPAGTYTISRKNFNCYLYDYDNDTTQILNLGSNNPSATFTLTQTTKLYIGFYVYQNSFDNLDLGLQLEEGSVTTPYLPYNTIPIKVQNKNIFDINTITENTFLLPSGVTGTSSVSNLSDYISVKANQTYYLSYSYDTLLDSAYRALCYYDKNKTYIDGISISPETFHTFNPTQDGFIRFSYDKNYTEIQIEKNLTNTPYVPHQEQIVNISLGDIELCKIGDYQDYFYKENNNWYIYKAIEKVVLNGSETFWNSGDVLGTKVYYFAKSSLNPSGNIPVSTSDLKCNYFKLATNNTQIYEGNFYAGVNWINFNFNNDNTNLAGFKTWLSTHNTTVYYPLATPTNTQITDTTLINQLNALEQAYSYNEQTNISQDGDLPFKLDIAALIELS